MNIINPKLLYMVLNVVVWGFVVENDSDQKYSGVCVYALSCFSWRTAISNKREPLLKRDPSSELHLGMHKIVASNIPTKYKLTFLSLLH